MTTQKHELAGPILWKRKSKQIAYGAVLVPNEPDSDGDILTAEKIEEAAHMWLADYSNIDLQHSLNNVQARAVESYITPVDMRVTLRGVDSILPAGTWIMATRIDDAEVWKDVESGKLSGYSIMGVRRNAAMKSIDDASEKRRTMLADLGADWICPFVSLVDEPAVPKAKFFAIKEAPKPSLFSRLFKVADEATKKQEDKMDENQIKEIVSSAVADALASQKAASEKIEQDAAQKSAEIKAAADAAADAAKKEAELKIAEMQKSHEEAMKSVNVKIAELNEKLATKSRAITDSAPDASSKSFEPRYKRDAFGNRI
jgi:hypothetical protein